MTDKCSSASSLSNDELALRMNKYKIRVEEKIKEKFFASEKKSPLRDACEYALNTGGKRYRPILVLMIGEALGRGCDVSEAALTVEFFHTASLIIDDLPCMDDDDSRRNKPTLHIVYGEAVAVLASFSLMSAGYECLAENARIKKGRRPDLGEDILRTVIENAAYNAGLQGATGGQFLDLYPPEITEEVVYEVIRKKTVSLFEISFVTGWLFGGGDTALLEVVKEAACHFGTAFQIADDLEDLEGDEINQRKINYAAVFGREQAYKTFHEEIDRFLGKLAFLSIKSPELTAVASLLIEKAKRAFSNVTI